MLFTHVSNFVHKSPKMAKLFRKFREEIAPVWVKIAVVFGQSIFIRSLIYQISSLVLEIFFKWVGILKFLILFCVWSIYVFSAPLFKKSVSIKYSWKYLTSNSHLARPGFLNNSFISILELHGLSMKIPEYDSHL